MPATTIAALRHQGKHWKLTCDKLLTLLFARSLLSGQHCRIFQRSKKGPALFHNDPMAGVTCNQLLPENIELWRPLCQSLHTDRPLRTTGVEHRQVILQDSKTGSALRLASENLKYRKLKTHIRPPDAATRTPHIFMVPADLRLAKQEPEK